MYYVIYITLLIKIHDYPSYLEKLIDTSDTERSVNGTGAP